MGVVFRQKNFSEYDAMRQLYVALMRNGNNNKNKIGIINPSALISVLRGNNIVIEKFTQATRVFGKDRYRMYIKIGAKAKLPDAVRLPQHSYNRSLGSINSEIRYDIKLPQGQKPKGNDNNEIVIDTNVPKNTNPKNKPRQKNHSDVELFRDGVEQKEFGHNNNGNKNNNNGGGGDGGKFIGVSFRPNVDFLKYRVNELLGDAISYNKTDRSLVLEFNDIESAIRSLNILPFGLGYGIYLLNA